MKLATFVLSITILSLGASSTFAGTPTDANKKPAENMSSDDGKKPAAGVSDAQRTANAVAPKTPVASWTCADFLAVSDEFKPRIIYAATAYLKGQKPSASVIDIDGTEKVTPMIVQSCQKTLQGSFMKNLKADWQKVEADAKSAMKKVEQKL